ncbi:MAG: 4-hydroxybenzoyl-CoA thioesterase [Bacteroidetes bacterium HGW-Bacteroidetes-3]|jgi:acyl-CoA thioester hydrolase|nr:MAG: 4-hydroxybenzoyl-CoA thioesterase [Bacteroidetes bacterium HGW-Bacteroidetes-3]
MKELLKDFKVVTVVKVRWGDMDAYQHVNNVIYVAWGEIARIDYFVALESEAFLASPKKMKYAPILGFQSVKYIAPLVFPDTIHIGTKTAEIKEDRIVLKSFYYSENSKKLVAIKTHEVVIFDYKTNQKILVPEEFIAKINNLENK